MKRKKKKEKGGIFDGGNIIDSPESGLTAVIPFTALKRMFSRHARAQHKLGFNRLARQVHADAKKKGFWPKNRTDAECIALMHSEISEALESCREPLFPKEPYAFITKFTPGKPDKPAGITEEMADVIIRVLDFCGARKLDIDKAIKMKMEYNKARKHKHGKKF